MHPFMTETLVAQQQAERHADAARWRRARQSRRGRAGQAAGDGRRRDAMASTRRGRRWAIRRPARPVAPAAATSR